MGGKRIAYAYIRKNACSAFKVALGFSPSTQVKEIAPNYPFERWPWYHATIFVWRDPEERLVSLYRNKILDRQDAADLLPDYRSTMGEEPSTFEKFAEYASLGADPHCRPQYDHLKPLRYSHAIPLVHLHEAMVEIVGSEAARPFAQNTNASVPHEVEITDRARTLIREHYVRDYQMIERLSRRIPTWRRFGQSARALLRSRS